MEFKIDWKIKNFREFPERKGQLLSSPIFIIDTLHNSQWVLHLYPYGDNDGNGQHTALYLVRKLDDDFPEDIMVTCQLSFVTSEWSTSIPWKVPPVSWNAPHHNFQKGSRCGSQEFLEKEKLSLYLEEGTLTVRCELLQYGADASIRGRCVALSLIGRDKRSFDWIIEDFQDLQPDGMKVTPIKSASKDAHSLTLSMTDEDKLMVNIFPIDRKRMKYADCSLYTRTGADLVYFGGNTVWVSEMRNGENWSFPLRCSKEYLLTNQVNGSLHIHCSFTCSLGVEFEKVEYTYYGPLSDQKNEACRIM